MKTASVRKQRPSGDTGTRILAAAEQVFADKGLKGARIKEIAALAEATPSLINYHFGGKENLYRTVIEDFYLRLERRLFPVMMESIDARRKLEKLVRVSIDILAEKEHVARILLRESIDKGRYVNEMLSKPYLREIIDMGDQFVFSNLKSSRRHGNDTIHLVSNIFGCMTMFFIAAGSIREIWKKDVFSRKMIEERKEEVVDFIFNGIGYRFK